MQVRALVDFHSQYGRIRKGQIFSSEPSYANEQLRLCHVEIIEEKPAHAPTAPGKVESSDAPPTQQESMAQPSPTSPDTEPTADDGQARQSSASPRARRSRRKT